MVSIEELYQLYTEHPIVSTDSRKIVSGCIFFALSGEHFDGNQYALEAIEKGAAYAVVDDEELAGHPQLLLVDDSLLALQELAALHRAKLSKPVIAITGTNGKTTTKELTAAVLSTTFNLLYTEGNLNNHIGVPLTLLRLTEQHDFALIEMGASKPGDIAELCEIAQPNYGLITNIGEAHLEGFQSILGVERTKAELYTWLREHDGKVIRREEDERLTRLSQGIPAVTYGTSSEAVIRAELKEQEDNMYLNFTWSAPAIQIDAQDQATNLVGAYNLDNALAAIAMGLFFGVSVASISKALSSYQPSNSRSQLTQTERNTLIIDAYNANPSSMHTALDNFAAIQSSKPKLLILGDMNELGSASEEAHHTLYNKIRSYGLEAIYCGPIWSTLLANTEESIFANADKLAEYLSANLISDHLILIKGSNGIKLNQISTLL